MLLTLRMLKEQQSRLEEKALYSMPPEVPETSPLPDWQNRPEDRPWWLYPTTRPRYRKPWTEGGAPFLQDLNWDEWWWLRQREIDMWNNPFSQPRRITDAYD